MLPPPSGRWARRGWCCPSSRSTSPTPDGKNAFFSVRNEISQPVDVRISVFAADRPQVPLHVETVSLAGKAIRPFDVRVNVPELLADDDGFARGYAVIETMSGDPVIQGEYFLLDPGEAFASGNRLVNADPQSADNDLCTVFTIRFLNGGFFDGGTDLIVWLDNDQLPSAAVPILTYVVYNQAGELRFFNDLFAEEVAFRRPADDLVSIPPNPTAFGALEIELTDGMRGHVLAVMSALGQFSVGVEAVCSD